MDWPTEIRTLMIDRKWSQRDLAAEVGMSPTYIGDVLAGKPASPTLKMRILDKRGYDLASAAVLRMLLPKDVAEELVTRERQRASDSAKNRNHRESDDSCSSKLAA